MIHFGTILATLSGKTTAPSQTGLRRAHEPSDREGNGIDLRPEWGIFIPSVLVIILISIPAVLYPKAAEEVVSAIYQPFAANFGTLYLWITVGLIILCVYFACSRYGDIKFGDPDEKPEFSLSSWIAMIFCSGVAGAVMFWSIIEPLWDIVQPPQYAAPHEHAGL